MTKLKKFLKLKKREGLFWLGVLMGPTHDQVAPCLWTYDKTAPDGWSTWWNKTTLIGNK
jgi:hypothetical protein